MAVVIPCDYLSMAEVSARWRIKPGSWDLHRALLGRHISPCVLLSGELEPLDIADGTPASTGQPPDVFAPTWLYPCYGVQTDKFEAVYSVVSDLPQGSEGARFWALPQPMALTCILDHGVMMMHDLEQAETALRKPREDDLSTKEKHSLLKLLRVITWGGYSLDPLQRGELVGLVVDDAKAQGIAISPGTTRRWLREAFANYSANRP